MFFEDQQRLAAAIEEFYILGVAANKNSDDCVRIVEYGKAIKSFSLSCGKEMVYSNVCKCINIL